MLLSRHYLAIVPCMLIASGSHAMGDDPGESFLNKTSLTHQALLKATQQGDVDTVMQLIQKQPTIIDSRDNHGNTLLVIASLNQKEELVKRLAQAGARVDFLEHTQIWGILDRTPQSACAKRILAFLRFIRSEEFLLYHNHRLQLPAHATHTSAARVPKIINTVLSCLRNAFYTSVDNAHDIEHDTVAVPHPAHAEYINTPSAAQLAPYVIRLYAATLDNNHTEITRILETNDAYVQDMILASAASIATRECNNQYLALFILFSRSGALKDIFFKKIMDSLAHN